MGEALDCRGDDVLRVKQVHGRVVIVVTPGQPLAPGTEADAIITTDPARAISVRVADCVPILIVDPIAGAAAAVHAGWRGTCAQVAPAAVAAMVREFRSRPEDLRAAIGPSAGPEDYEVGETLVEAFTGAGHSRDDIDRWFIRTSTRPNLDLWRANADQLRQSGVAADHIYTCGLSTVSHPDVFDSYRVHGERAGRMAALIAVPLPA